MSTVITPPPPKVELAGFYLLLGCSRTILNEFYKSHWDKFNDEEVKHFEIYKTGKHDVFEVELLFEHLLPMDEVDKFVGSSMLKSYDIRYNTVYYTSLNCTAFNHKEDKIIYSYERVKSNTKNAAKINHT